MCGICGILNFGASEIIDKGLLQKMCDSLIHRGPDEGGIYISSSFSPAIGLGHRRLSIIDLDTGTQPIHNEDRTIWIVFNGEIYNFHNLKTELQKKGHRFYTRTDTEVIVHLYEDMHEECVNELNGMFSFAIWDEKEKRLILARDRVGIKPLFYCLEGNKLIFASEIKSMLVHSDIDRALDLTALYSYLSYQYIPYPRTIFKKIKKLSPGHILSYTDGRIFIKRYWDITYNDKLRLGKKEEYIERINVLLADSVRLRLVGDVPVGAFLSGGIDSSTVVGLMAKFTTRPVRTFSMGFREESFNELDYARIVSRHFRTEHYEFVVNPPVIVKLLPKLIQHFGEPFGDPSAIPTYMVSELARTKVKVCLSGDGGDEVFAGYYRYIGNRAAEFFSGIPHSLIESIKSIIEKIPEKADVNFIQKLKRFIRYLHLSPQERYINLVMIFDRDMKYSLITRQFQDELEKANPLSEFLGFFESHNAYCFLDKVLYTDVKTYLPGDLLNKVDITSMANSLEVRVPFLDHRLIEFMARVPADLKVRGFNTKYILKQTMKGILPRRIIHRKKHGFGVPIGRWFREQLGPYVRDVLLDTRTLKRGYFNQRYVQWMINQHLSGRRDFSHNLWLLLVFELWCRMYVDGTPDRI